MPTSTRFGSEPEEPRLLEGVKAGTREAQASSNESAWDTFRRNLNRRRQQLPSPSSSLSRAKNRPMEHSQFGPWPGDKEESKFGEALIGLMQRSGRFNYCDFSDCGQTGKQESNKSSDPKESLQRLLDAPSGRHLTLDSVNQTWRNLTNQCPRLVRKAVSSPR